MPHKNQMSQEMWPENQLNDSESIYCISIQQEIQQSNLIGHIGTISQVLEDSSMFCSKLCRKGCATLVILFTKF